MTIKLSAFLAAAALVVVGCHKPTPVAAPVPPAPPDVTPAHKPECAQCVIEDQRQAAHRNQVTVVARFVGWVGRWFEGKSTRRLCTTGDEVVGVGQFELVSTSPWPQHPARLFEAELPCPELSRPEYAKLYHYDPNDTERDGLGQAPQLQPGHRYRLTFVRNAALAEPRHPLKGDWLPVLVAVNPL